MLKFSVCLLLVLLFFISENRAEILIKNLKIGISDKAGDIIFKKGLTFPEKLDEIKDFDLSNKFIAEFEVKSSDGPEDEKFVLNYANLFFTSLKTNAQISSVAKLLPNKNKYKVVMTGRNLFSKMSVGGKYQLELALGSFKENPGILYDIGTLNLVGSGVKDHAEARIDQVKPEIHHIFSQPERMVIPIFSYIITAISAVPFFLFYLYVSVLDFL
ncbi:hypothetical protein BB560_005822 [Smittium megazygosporum]|uniref:Ribophorin II third domain-containing protein n=1 Tax=Smittium megazygosporum TaxID=133381 RepID=A0A2T9YV24_9FUNG|nr:hypothetical protein BB560_005822 [Smittium megazygosporum]